MRSWLHFAGGRRRRSWPRWRWRTRDWTHRSAGSVTFDLSAVGTYSETIVHIANLGPHDLLDVAGLGATLPHIAVTSAGTGGQLTVTDAHTPRCSA